MVDAVAREWLRELREDGDYEERELDDLMSTFFAIFYVDDAYLASRDPEFLQRALDLLVSLFARVGLETNVSKTQTMICTPGRIRTQLPADSYRRLIRTGDCDVAVSRRLSGMPGTSTASSVGR
jgi:hypothetical protein